MIQFIIECTTKIHQLMQAFITQPVGKKMVSFYIHLGTTSMGAEGQIFHRITSKIMLSAAVNEPQVFVNAAILTVVGMPCDGNDIEVTIIGSKCYNTIRLYMRDFTLEVAEHHSGNADTVGFIPTAVW